MKILHEPKSAVLSLLKVDADALPPFRKYSFSDEIHTSDGVLLLNFVTNEVLLLKDEDFLDKHIPDTFEVSALKPSCREYLLTHRFIVNEGNNDAYDVDYVRKILRAMERFDADGINAFTILTTTDCNARCYYCYEKGTAKIKMDEKTAEDAAEYILKNCSKNPKYPVHLSWFGGEPLYNDKAIDIICRKLTEGGRPYTSSMITNGLLLDRAMVSKAVELWKLKKIQITLDGTEQIYNKTKAYIGGIKDAYQTVLANIDHALSAGIRVSIRLNISEGNIADLNLLADELAERFSERGLNVYGHLLFQYDEAGKDQAKKKLQERAQCLKEKLTRLGFSGRKDGFELTEKEIMQGNLSVRLHECMADSPDSVLIMPDGRLHSCEHIVDKELWGSIYTGETKHTRCFTASSGEKVSPLNYWEETAPSDECLKCKFYPFCIKLKHCPNATDGCSLDMKERVGDRVEAIEQYFVKHCTM